MAMHTSIPHKPHSQNNPAAEGKRKRQSVWSSYQQEKFQQHKQLSVFHIKENCKSCKRKKNPVSIAVHFDKILGEETPWTIDWWNFSDLQRTTSDNLHIQQAWTKFPSFIHE